MTNFFANLALFSLNLNKFGSSKFWFFLILHEFWIFLLYSFYSFFFPQKFPEKFCSLKKIIQKRLKILSEKPKHNLHLRKEWLIPYYNLIDQETLIQWENEYTSQITQSSPSSTTRVYYKYNPSCNSKADKYLTFHNLERKHTMPLVWLRTRHIPLKAHIKQNLASINCPHCQTIPETIEHFLYTCPKYVLQRQIFHLKLKQIHNIYSNIDLANPNSLPNIIYPPNITSSTNSNKICKLKPPEYALVIQALSNFVWSSNRFRYRNR